MMYSKVLRNDKRMKTSFILVFLIILGHFGQASNKDKKSKTKSTVKKFFKRSLGESKSQAGSQKEKKRGKILLRSDGSSAEFVVSEHKQFLEIVTEKIPTGLDKKYLSCETLKKLCVEDHGGHCTDDGEKCCEMDACIVCYAGWSGPTCNIRKESSSSEQSSSSESGSSSSTDTEPKVLCNSNPCKNGGICNGVDGSCHCINGYTGPLCETTNSGPRVTCHQTPCKNGGTCLDTPDGTCSCINGYTGPLCETPNSGTRPSKF